ncbi:hypothetical protein AB1K84_00450 [Mesobacillus foraminis]|uniref:hypothetical protein n=1 Tax=Mesobacillus foraminis TaxID=279826 RepID=UPI0039A0F43E
MSNKNSNMFEEAELLYSINVINIFTVKGSLEGSKSVNGIYITKEGEMYHGKQ